MLFLRSRTEFYRFGRIFFFKKYNDGKFRSWGKIKGIRNLFRLKKEPNYTAIRNIRNLFRLKKSKAIKDRIHRGIKNPFEHKEEENYY